VTTLFFINCALVVAVVMIHYWALFYLVRLTPFIKTRNHYRIVLGVLGALIAHATEVWIFALAYFFLNRADGYGNLAGNTDGSLVDCGYFSFVTYTTAAYGDIYPEGSLRFTAGIESLAGLVLITWTASFLFLEMQRHWGKV
jgi:hypothetical protein